MKLKIYFRVKDLAIDEAGRHCPAGMCLDLGQINREIPYEKIASNIDKEKILKYLMLTDKVSPEDMEIITPDEYQREFGDDDA